MPKSLCRVVCALGLLWLSICESKKRDWSKMNDWKAVLTQKIIVTVVACRKFTLAYEINKIKNVRTNVGLAVFRAIDFLC